ncbi:MAG: ABC transporter permease, partial [Gammaproteobacteria bacterium]
MINILKNVSFLTLLALGFTCALITSELDLSFANIASLCSVVAASLLYGGYPVIIGIVACLLLGTAAGALNGFLITCLKIPSLITTLATGTISSGLAFMMTGGIAYVGKLSGGFLFLGRGVIFGFPVLIVWVAIAVIALLILFKQFKLGAHLVGTGESEDAALLAGIPVKKMKTFGMTLSGFFAALGGLLLTANLSSS